MGSHFVTAYQCQNGCSNAKDSEVNWNIINLKNYKIDEVKWKKVSINEAYKIDEVKWNKVSTNEDSVIYEVNLSIINTNEDYKINNFNTERDHVWRSHDFDLQSH